MSIILDGNTFTNIMRDGHEIEDVKIATTERGATGSVLRTESGYFGRTYTIRLACTRTEMRLLRNSFRKATPPTNLLVFTDQEGVTWDTAAGTDTSTDKHSTGVYFERFTPRSTNGTGWASTADFEVTIVLRVNAKILPEVT